MNKNIRITDAEWEIMVIIWDNPHISGSDIVKIVETKKKWNYRTVKTLISRLVAKRAIKYKKKGNTYYYYSSINKKDTIRKESLTFMRKVFNGATTPMLAYLVKQSKLTKNDIKELKKILNEKEKTK